MSLISLFFVLCFLERVQEAEIQVDQWGSERLIEELYRNRTDGCEGEPSILCSLRRNGNTLAERAVEMARGVCQLAFRYDLWPCRINRRLFKTATKERSFLQSLAAASLFHTTVRYCRITGVCHGNLDFAEIVIRDYLKKTVLDPQGIVAAHNIQLGIQVVKNSSTIRCFCHDITTACTRKCRQTLASFSTILEILKDKYYSAVKWNINNSMKPRRRDLKGLRERLVYLEETEDLCKETRGRLCPDEYVCGYLCCGRGYANTTTQQREYCNCVWSRGLLLVCSLCTVPRLMFYCN